MPMHGRICRVQAAITATSQQSRFYTETLEGGGSKDVDLRGVALHIGDAELLADAHLRLYFGQRYGLVGRCGGAGVPGSCKVEIVKIRVEEAGAAVMGLLRRAWHVADRPLGRSGKLLLYVPALHLSAGVPSFHQPTLSTSQLPYMQERCGQVHAAQGHWLGPGGGLSAPRALPICGPT